MEEQLSNSLIRGLLFSAFDRMGPMPIYIFPKNVNEEELRNSDMKETNGLKLTLRDYIQISIKNLSLLLGDKASADYHTIQEQKHFAILPYPDFKLTSLTFFRFINLKTKDEPVPVAFSILVEENRRSYLYSNVNRIKPLIDNFFENLYKEVIDEYKPQEDVEPIFRNLLLKLIDLEKRPYTPVTAERKLKILFAGLDDSGKTSFLLTVDRKYSKLMGLKPTRGVNVKSIDALGATIFLWDLGGQKGSRDKYLTKSQIYLYEADLIFYFIDIKNQARFEESINYLKNIQNRVKEFEQKTPFIFLFSKGDPDVIDSKEVKDNTEILKSKLVNDVLKEEPEVFITSIFNVFSVLRAFSSGISKLSPNRELINFNLEQYSKQLDIYLTLMLNVEGLVLADYYSNKALDLTELPRTDLLQNDSLTIRNIFEVTAPQFALLYKIFSKFKQLEQNEAVFKISNSVILFKKVDISNQSMFVLFLMDEENKIDNINKSLPDFLTRTNDLILRYIS
jgi:GTPase SAR1 family protein